jgi:hypothetical protein
MAAVTRRSYAGAAPACTLTSSITSGDTTASLTGTVTNWPTTAGGPFHMVIDPGLSTEEKVLVGSRSTGSLSSITRGVDGTSASSHSAGATCYPVFTATDADEANTLASVMTTRGDLIVMGSGPTVARLGIGTNGQVLVSNGTDVTWGAGTSTLDSLTDVVITSVSSSQILSYNGTNWVNSASPATGGDDAGIVLGARIFG